MKLKYLLSDKTFLALIWPHILGFVSQGIAALVLVIALWGLSSSFASFRDVLQFEMGRIVKWSIFLVILFNGGFLYINLVVMKYYQFAPPIGASNSNSNLQEISRAGNQKDKTGEYFFKYVGPSVIFIIVALDFIKVYFVDGARGEALRPALTFILPFAIALVIAHFSRIAFEVVILFLRYTIQIMRY